jgi:hypothetical protein
MRLSIATAVADLLRTDTESLHSQAEYFKRAMKIKSLSAIAIATAFSLLSAGTRAEIAGLSDGRNSAFNGDPLGNGALGGYNVTLDYEVTSVSYHFSKSLTIPDSVTYPELDASAVFNFESNRIVVHAYNAAWTSGGFNGFTLTDTNSTFTSFTLGSLTGDNPAPVPPELTFDAHHLTVDFTPGGISTFGDLTYTFLFTTTQAPSMNLLVNGSFENPQIAPDSFSSSPLPHDAIPGWLGTGDAPWEIVNGHIVFGWEYPLAPNGNQWVSLGDAPSTLSQSFTIPAPGLYRFTWADNTAIPPDSNTSPYIVTVLDGAGDIVVSNNFDAGHDGAWKYRSLDVELSAGSGTIRFTANQEPGGWATIIDDVSLSSPTVAPRYNTAITWPVPSAITYGTALSPAQLNASATYNGQPVAGSFTYSPPIGTVLNAGENQTLAVTFTPDNSVQFASVTSSVAINVQKAPLTITAVDTGKWYGQLQMSDLNVSYSGFVNGEGPAALTSLPVCQTSVGQYTPVGTYPITVAGASAANYDITYVSGTFYHTLLPPASGPMLNPVNGHRYYLLENSEWFAAEEGAKALGGHLATIRNQQEQDWVYNTFGQYGGMDRHLWLGLYDTDLQNNANENISRRAEFAWTSGEPVTYANWGESEPSGNRYGPAIMDFEAYGHMFSPAANTVFPGLGGRWNDSTPEDWGFDFTGVPFAPLNGVAEIIPSGSVTGVPPASIGINFQGRKNDNSPTDPLGSTEVAGVVPQAYWNTINDSAQSSPEHGTTALIDSEGNPTTVTLTYDANDSWNNDTDPSTITTGNARLMNGIIKANGGNGVTETFTLNGLPNGQYDVYVYMNGNNADSTALNIGAGAFLTSSGAAPVLGPNGHYYEVVAQRGIPWSDANLAAEAASFLGLHGHLVTITSAAEDTFVRNLAAGRFDPATGSEVWAGGFQSPVAEADPKAGWTWVNNEGSIPGIDSASPYAEWAPLMPDDAYGPASEQYLGINLWGPSGGWNDEGNLSLIQGYVVEYEGELDPVAAGSLAPTYYVRENRQFTDSSTFVQAMNTDPLSDRDQGNYVKFSGLDTLNRNSIQIVVTHVADSDGCGIAGLQIVNAGSIDTTPPNLVIPTNITAEATSAAGAVISFNVSAHDNSDGDLGVVSIPSSGSSFPLGKTTVTVSATDSHGNSASGHFTVIVVDTTPPVIAALSDITVPSSINAQIPVNYAPATVTDIVDANPTVTYSMPSGSLFPIGTTIVTATARDASGNASTRNFKVIRQALQFSGFLSPIDGADASGGNFGAPLRTFKYGSTIPVKFSALCNGSPVLTGVHKLQIVKYSTATTSGVPIDVIGQGLGTSGNQFALTGSDWHFNLDTKASHVNAGIWQMLLTLSDGSQHTAWVQIKN